MLGIYVLLGCLSWYYQNNTLLFVWILPLLIGQPFLRLFLLAEHEGCANSNNMFENTRTTLSNFAVRFITWNMPYHTEHHVFPAAPFHQLPKLHEFTKLHLQVVAPGYGRYHLAWIKARLLGKASGESENS